MSKRTPKPFINTARMLWYVQISGRQINLGRDEAEAWRQYHVIMSQPPEVDAQMPPA